jgi:hypothetical protein
MKANYIYRKRVIRKIIEYKKKILNVNFIPFCVSQKSIAGHSKISYKYHFFCLGKAINISV